MNHEQPWLSRKEWKTNKIFSNAKLGMYILWGFTIVWNLISLPIFIDTEDLINKILREPETALVLLFPLVGIMLVFASINALKNWQKFGATPLVLDPFPGSISGHVGGFVQNRIPFDSNHQYKVSLTCFHSYMSGSGKNRSRKEKVIWQTEGVCFSEPVDQGTQISWRFSTPDELPESAPKKTSSYHVWRVAIHCELPGTDYDRQFEIPVYKGQRYSETIKNGTEEYHRTVDSAQDGIYEIAQIKSIPGGLDIYYPLLKRPIGGIMATVFGLLFAGAGLFMSSADDVPLIFPLTFTPIGILILLIGVWELGKSLKVKLDRDNLHTRRFFWKYPITSRSTPTNQVTRIELKEGSTVSNGRKKTVYYSLIAHTSNKKRIVIAERLNSKPEAKLLRETLEGYFQNLSPAD